MMNKVIFDTRFLQNNTIRKMNSQRKELKSRIAQRGNYVSAVVIHECTSLPWLVKGEKQEKALLLL